MNRVLFALFVLCLFISMKITAQTAKNPDYSSTPRIEIPEQYTWNVNDIYPNESAWENEKNDVKILMAKIPVKSKGWTLNAKAMYNFFKFRDSISIKLNRLSYYTRRLTDADMGNSKYQVMKGEINSIAIEYSAKLAFMNDDLLKLTDKQITKFISGEPKLKMYEFALRETMRSRSKILPSVQQNIVNYSNLFSSQYEEAAGLLNDVEMPAPDIVLSDGTKLHLNYPNYLKGRASKQQFDRTLVMNTFWNNHKQFENTIASLFNGEMNQHLFSAKVGKFNTCLEAKLFNNDIDTNVYMQLIKNVNKNLASLHKFLRLKKELLGVNKFKYEDMYASAVKKISKEYSYAEAKELVLASLKIMGNEYTTGLKTAFDNRWIDIYPNKGKETGAYSAGIYGVHPFVKMNFDGKYDAVSTLAHELGHAMHSYFSYKYQPYTLAPYPTFLAEIASTFNENMLMEYMLKNENDDMFKLFIIDNYLDQVRQTIFRQTLFAEFELEMHRMVEKGKKLTADELSKLYLTLTRKYYGHDLGVTEVDSYIQNEWSIVPHFFMNFYVFQYSTGMIASMAFTEKVLSGNNKELENYLALLKSGGCDHPINLLKKAGIDMTTSEPAEAAFKRFDYLVNQMEKIVAKLKLENKL